MKEIRAIIQPFMLSRVIERLHALPHFPGFTVSACQGQGRGRGAGGRFQPEEASIDLLDKTKLEIFCADEVCEELVALIQSAARTGNDGDGVIMVADLPRVVRIRTGEEQKDAV